MKQPRFKSHYNAELFPPSGERNVQPSLAVPDMALSLQEIIKRHTRGLPIYGSEMNFETSFDPLGGRHINSLDIEEVWQIAEASRKKYKEAQDKYIADQKLKQHQQYKEQLHKEFLEIQQKANPKNPNSANEKTE